MPPDNLVIRVDAINNTRDEFRRIKQDLREIRDLQGGTIGTAGAREREQIRARERAAEANLSREKVANTRREQAADNNRSREAVQASRREGQAENIRHREKLANQRAEQAAIRATGADATRTIQRQRLEEQRLAREQRDRHFLLRQQQSQVRSGITGWTQSLREFATFLGGDIIFSGFSRIIRRVGDVTAEFERLRLGLVALAGDSYTADRQLARLRQLADLPGIGFTQGIRAFTGLRSAGLGEDLSIRLYREVANAASLAGATQEDISENLRQFRQIFSAERFTQQDVRPIVQRNPLIQRAFLEAFGSIQAGDINTAIAAQGLTIEQSFQRIVEVLERGPRAAANTLTNMMEILGDAFDDLARDIGRDIIPLLRGFVSGLTRVIEFFRTPFGRTIFAGGTGALVGGVGGAAFGGLTGASLIGAGGIAGGALGAGSFAQALGSAGIGFADPLIRGGASLQDLTDAARQHYAGQRTGFFGRFANQYGRNRARGLRPALNLAAATGGRFSQLLNIGVGPLLSGALIGGTTAAAAQFATTSTQRVVSGEEVNILERLASFIGGGGFTGRAPIGFEGGRDYTRIASQLTQPGRVADATVNFTRALNAITEALEQSTNGLRGVDLETVQNFTSAFEQFIQSADTNIESLQRQRQAASAEIQNIIERSFREGRTPGVSNIDRALRERDIETDVDRFLSNAQRERIEALRTEIDVIDDSINAIRRGVAARQSEERGIRQGESGPLGPPRGLPQGDTTFRVTPEEATGTYYRIRGETDSRFIPGEGFGTTPRPQIQFRRPQVRPGGAGVLRDRFGAEVGLSLRGPDPGGPFERFQQLNQALNDAADGAGNLINQIRPLEQGFLLNRLNQPIATRGITGGIGSLGGLGPPGESLTNPLFNPDRLSELRRSTRSYVLEWRDLGQAYGEFVRETQAPDLFTVRSQQFAEVGLREVRDTLARLREFQTELQGFGEEVPSFLTAQLEGAINQAQSTINSLRLIIADIREARQDLQDVEVLSGRREREIDERVFLRDQQFFQLSPENRRVTRDDLNQLPFFGNRNRADRERRQRERLRLTSQISGAGNQLYEQFIAPGILDFVGIGSVQTRQRERAIDNLTRSIEQARQEVRDNELLNERQQTEQLLEINREYQRELREIDRLTAEQRSDAWGDFVRQQLTDIPRLIAAQLNLRLAERGADLISGLPGLGRIFGGSSAGGGASAVASGAGAGTAVGTAGVAVGAGLAIHNVGTGIREGLFNDIGTDFVNGITEVLAPAAPGRTQNAKLYVVSGDQQIDIGVDGVRAFSTTMQNMVDTGRL